MSDLSTGAAGRERRRYERLRPDRPVALRCTEGIASVVGWGKAYDVPALLDLSPAGARFAMLDAPQVGSVLHLDLQTDRGKSFEAIVDVRWSRSVASRVGVFQCGVEFFKSTARQRREIDDLCRRVHRGLEEVLWSPRRGLPN